MHRVVWKFLRDYWERLLFGLVGFACLIFGFKFLYDEKVPYASAVFALAFFSFLYSNLSRFKRFKGLGFEAELWEDKQKEAADLIERLKSVVAVYTREVVMNNVLRGRWGDGADWKARWALYDELVNQHDMLGQKIDFSDLKRKIDGIFIFDLCTPLESSVNETISKAKKEARKAIEIEFGSPITDVEGYGRKLQKLNAIGGFVDDAFHRSEYDNIAQEILGKASAAKISLQRDFSINVDFDPRVTQKLKRVAKLHDNRPLKIDDKLIEMDKKLG